MKKTVLLTGGAGFIGAHTIEHLLRNTDWNIVLMDRLTYAGNLNRLTAMDCWNAESHRVRFVYHDFRSPITGKLAELIVGRDGLDYIIHMGAETHVDRSIQDSDPFVQSNVVGTVNMLEFAKYALPDRFIYVSTDEVYGAVTADGQLHKEGEPHNPSNPYAASKAAGEDFCRSYVKTHGVPVIITNTMNNFGERQDVEKFVPKTLRAIVRNEPVILHCRKQAEVITDISTRCWLHARNHADALVYVINHGAIGENYNVVGELASVAMVADLIANTAGRAYKPEFIDFHSTRPGHDMHYGLDGTKLETLGWKPPVPFVESLENTIKWTLAHPEWL